LANRPLRVLTVFLASPGDLAEERKIAREVVDQLNKAFRGIGWLVELLGWEDTLPGFARPQDVINQEVESCELFVGLLWRRWGQPTGSPTYTSGFEEEFENARRRRLAGGAPELWIFFKAVDPALIEDAGDQLKRVLAFRKAQETSKELYYREFADASD